jgi:signal recognition particle subunit SRP54
MVLAELGAKISGALRKLNQASVIDEKLLTEILTEIASALMSADVNIKYVMKMRESVKTQVNLLMSQDGGGANLRKLIQRIVVQELTNMLECETKPYEFKKGKPNVVMLVGL